MLGHMGLANVNLWLRRNQSVQNRISGNIIDFNLKLNQVLYLEFDTF